MKFSRKRRQRGLGGHLLAWISAVACAAWGLCLLATVFHSSSSQQLESEASFHGLSIKNHKSQIHIPGPMLSPSETLIIHKQQPQGLLSLSAKLNQPYRCANASVIQHACLSQQQHCLSHDAREIVSVTTSNAVQCKTLWFSGFHEGPTSRCSSRGIRMEYAAALASAKRFASGVLQPVLLLGRLGLEPEEDVSGLRQWAADQGAIVVTVDRLSIQENIENWHSADTSIGFEHLMGPYLRMDIPFIIEKYSLFSLPGICDQYVLYTDSDSLFVNTIEHSDIEMLKHHMRNRLMDPNLSVLRFFYRTFLANEPPYLLYGREGLIGGRKPKNTGVMLIDAPRFGQELGAIIRFRDLHPNPSLFQAFDQGLLNTYFERSYRTELGRHMLPLYWNWKLYWTLEPASMEDLKLIHFHGPKPNRDARLIAQCDTDFGPSTPMAYWGMIKRGVCCDQGKVALAVLELFKDLKPSDEDVC